MKHKASFTDNGFTLIEILVAMAVFSVVVTAGINLLGSAVHNQKKVLLWQEALNNSSYVLEYISRSLRMAKKDLQGACLSTPGDNFENPGGVASKIRFLSYRQKCQEFFLEQGQVKQRKSSDETSANFGFSQPLTSKNLQVSKLGFAISGSSQDDEFQPKVTIALGIETGHSSLGISQFQTTVSQRDLDVRY